jgi:acyl carrier protein
LSEKLRSQLASIVAKELNIEPASLNDRLRSQIPSWDSLKHLELILRLEQQFHVRFSSKEVADIQSLDDFLRLIEAKS